LKIINSVKKTNGMVKIKIKIFEMEENVNVFVINKQNFNYDFLIGLDIIQKFKLIQNEELKIAQKLPNTTQNNIENKDYYKRNNKNPELTGNNKKINITRNEEMIPEISKAHSKRNGKFTINFNEHIDEYDFEISINHLDYQQKAKINEIIQKYKSIFAKNKYDIGIVKDYEAHIDVCVDKYCSKRPYRCNIEDR